MKISWWNSSIKKFVTYSEFRKIEVLLHVKKQMFTVFCRFALFILESLFFNSQNKDYILHSTHKIV